jgi:hypothetical protein
MTNFCILRCVFLAVNYLFCYMSILHNKITHSIFGIFFSNKVKTKVQKGFGFWTFINVHFWKSEKSLEKDPIF